MKKISFPRIGNYHVPFGYFVGRVFDAEVVVPPPITRRTVELGSAHSPDFVCAPFKFNLGNHIEALEMGADTLIQFGGLCRLGYYGELHEQILRDLGYRFDFINLAGMRARRPKSVWDTFRKHVPRLSLGTLASSFSIMYAMIEQMDEIEMYIRQHAGFEREAGALDRIYGSYLREAAKARTRRELRKLFSHYAREIKRAPLDIPKNPVRVGVIGEYYTIMEPFSNHFLEKELAAMRVHVGRNMNVSSTVFHGKVPRTLKKVQQYVKYDIGATGVETINAALGFARKGYDGLIHVKSFGCMPEIDAMKVLQNISQDLGIPILYLSFDTQTGETGVKTRLEAFHDMLVMRKNAGG